MEEQDWERSCVVVRGKGKTLRFLLREDGTVEIHAPKVCPDFLITLFLHKNRELIARRRAEVMARAAEKRAAERFVTVRLVGKDMPVLPAPPGSRKARLEKGCVYLPEGTRAEQIALLQEFYKEQAHAYLPLRAEEWAAHFGFEIRGVKITSARKRWGSCNNRGGLNFSWRLMMAPPEAIDSVIIHELMHRIEFNHSKAFRALEKQNVPNYEECQKQLRETARHIGDI